MATTTGDLSKISQFYANEHEARELLDSLRWPNGPVCPHPPPNFARVSADGTVGFFAHDKLPKGASRAKEPHRRIPVYDQAGERSYETTEASG